MDAISTNRKITLNNNIQFPCFGFGTYQMRKKTELENAINEAYKCGYRLFDTAKMYGNEKIIGDAIKKYKIPREEIFLTTKVPPEDMSYAKAKKVIENSLSKLQTNYLDLVLVHWPGVSKDSDRVEVWKALEESVDEKKVKMIGVSNFCKPHLQQILKNCKIKPVINQIECNPIYWDKETINYSKQNNIIIESYCPLAEWDSKLVENDVLKKIASNKGKSVAQIILRWLLQKEVIPLPRSGNKSHIRENININDFQLTDSEMNEINDLNKINYKVDWDPHHLLK